MLTRRLMWLLILTVAGIGVLLKLSVLTGTQYSSISPVLRVSSRHSTALASPQGPHSVDKIPILMYHKVSPSPIYGGYGLRTTPGGFERQLKYLKKHGYHAISLKQLTDYWNHRTPLPARPVVITFDDGYEDNYLYAFPLLQKYGYKATIFLVYNDIGGYNIWDRGKKVAQDIPLLSWQQIHTMQKYGMWFESHTMDHRDLTTLTWEDAGYQLRQSKTRLQNALGTPVDYIAYPYGKNSLAIRQATRLAGYTAAFSTASGKSDSSTDRFNLKRLRVNGFTDMGRFARMMEQ